MEIYSTLEDSRNIIVHINLFLYWCPSSYANFQKWRSSCIGFDCRMTMAIRKKLATDSSLDLRLNSSLKFLTKNQKCRYKR